ncbi:nucleoprotein TPR-like [Nilaparvata lugens]|uniref:nucleoprotein TPR-like n=1 Tax=Nilaparvata lugens TaxID=108931 RepID=UPI00193D60F2|nr:nucleoprotein TPR-like [Nilaparvata lugens]
MAESGGLQLSKALNNEEIEKIDLNIRDKLEKFLNETLDDYLTAKAVYETSKVHSDEKITSLSNELVETKTARNSLQNELERAQDELKELRANYCAAKEELAKLNEKVKRLDEESVKLRHERNVAVDERVDAVQMVGRRDAQLQRLQEDVATLTKQLDAAILAKCQAIAQLDNLDALKMELDYKEKRLTKEKTLLLEQIQGLSVDVAKHNTEMVNLRREHTANVLLLQSQLSEKTEELQQSQSSCARLKEVNQGLTKRIENLTENLVAQCEKETKANVSYSEEIKAQTRIADLYKGLSEEAASKNAELMLGVKELQDMLKDASQQFGELETSKNQEIEELKVTVANKNECIAQLKKELVHANDLVKVAKEESIDSVLENLAPSAAAASRLIKSGMTLTQIYCQYATVSEELILEKANSKKLNLYINTILKELDEKAPILKKQREDYDYAMNTVETMTIRIDEMENEIAKLRHRAHEAEKTANHHTRENKRLSDTISDLSRQVCFLLKEVEESRGTVVPMLDSPQRLKADMNTSLDVISKHLVTFSDIQELQTTNQKLLAVIRELSNKQEQDEKEKESAKIEDLQNKVRSLEELYNEMMDNDKYTRKALDVVKGQRDTYKLLFHQHVQGKNVKLPDDIESEKMDESSDDVIASPSPVKPKPAPQSDSNNEVQKKLDEANTNLQNLKQEFESYRKERATNEKMLNEELDRYRTDVQNKIKQISALVSRAEYAEQNFKTLQSNANMYKMEVASLQTKINSYTSITGKQEQTITHLKDEALNANSKLCRAEVMLENLKKEYQLLKESEARLSKEREILMREQHGQQMLLSNLNIIKASMERMEVEGRVKLESRLDDATKECSALRQRLQDEQDRFRERVDHLEKQTALAKQRQAEEEELAKAVRLELDETKQQLQEKQQQLEQINSKMREVKHTILPDPSTEERARTLEQQLLQKENEIAGLKEQLALSKKNVSQYDELSHVTEKQLAEVTESYNKYKEEATAEFNKLNAIEVELKSTISKLEEEVRVLTSNKEEAVQQLREVMSVQNEQLAGARTELAKTKETLDKVTQQLRSVQEVNTSKEAKYAEAVEHNSRMQQELTNLKAELDILREDNSKIEREKMKALEALTSGKTSWETQESSLKKELESMNERFNNLNKANDLLHEQLEALGTKLIVSKPQGSSGGEAETSLTEDEIESNDKLIEVMKYLRNEKCHAVNQLETLKDENLNLRAKAEVLQRQLDDLNKTLSEECSNKNIDNMTVVKHNELLKKIETLSSVEESNQLLREENKKWILHKNNLEKQHERIQNDIIKPLQEKNSTLQTQVDELSLEISALKNESARWKQRSENLLEKSNKTSPEDIKRMIVEKEALQKSLQTEKEETRVLRLDKKSLEDQLTVVKRQQNLQNEEISSLKNQMAQMSKELAEQKEEMKKKEESVTKLQADIANHEAALAKAKLNEAQIRNIAKKYKQQVFELTKKIDEKKESEGQEVSLERVREESRREAETAHAERLRELTDQVSTTQAEADELRKENHSLKASSNEKEERAKVVLKNAKAHIMRLKEEKQVLSDELVDVKSKLDHLDRNKDDASRRSDNHYHSENERLQREVDLLTQRLSAMQRQLEKQQGSKLSTSSGLAEKTNTDPPTANIKPMAGPSSSGTKQQSIQHSATVTPWRSVQETPFASIRPLSMQSSRTLAVLPTTNQSQQTGGQAVLVPPQQQLVHTSSGGGGGGSGGGSSEALSSSSPTSSHTDYMPATSSATIRQATVPPTVTAEVDERNAETQQQGQSSQVTQAVSIALVLPQFTAQTSNSHTTQTQVVSAENSSAAVSASNQQVEQSPVSPSAPSPSPSPSSHPPPTPAQASSNNFVSASNACSASATLTYYRQDVDVESAGESEQQGVVASSQQGEQSVTVGSSGGGGGGGSQPPGPSDAPEHSLQSEQQAVASSRQDVGVDQSVATSGGGGSGVVVGGSSGGAAGSGGGSQVACSSQASSSSSSNTVTTTQTTQGLKRPLKQDDSQSPSKGPPQMKRKRVALTGSGSGELVFAPRADGLEVEYQVPTSSQRDQEDDIILVDSSDEPDDDDDDDMPDDGDMGMTSHEFGEGPDIDENDQDNNEVEILDDSNEVPNQSENSNSAGVGGVGGGGSGGGGSGGGGAMDESGGGHMSEATSSGGGGVSASSAGGHFASARRPTAIAPLLNSRQQQQQQLILPGGSSYDDTGDDSIVPSTPTLFVPRRSDGFGEAVSSPHVLPSLAGRFTFSDNSSPSTRAGVAQVASEGMDDTRMDLSQLEDSGTGRSVPTTPLQVSPQAQSEVGQSSSEDITDGNNIVITVSSVPSITISHASHDMPPPSDVELEEQAEAGLSGGSADAADVPEMASLDLPEEGADGVSSEGEKSHVMDEMEDEGREAEASLGAGGSGSGGPGGPMMRGASTARRSMRMSSSARSRARPARITWNEENAPHFASRGQNVFRGRGFPPMRGQPIQEMQPTGYRGRARRGKQQYNSFQQRF